MKIGVLALQGDFAEHHKALTNVGAQAVDVRYASQLAELDGLIIPGGESTTLAKLTQEAGSEKSKKSAGTPIFKTIQEKARQGMPIYGTCMGSIFLAKDIEGTSQSRLGLMDIKVRRNAFGAQKKSFECDVDIPVLEGEPFPAVFIRAPIIVSCGSGVEALASIELDDGKEGIVMARQKNLLVTAFHPEMTGDLRIHKYFTTMVKDYLTAQNARTREFDVSVS